MVKTPRTPEIGSVRSGNTPRCGPRTGISEVKLEEIKRQYLKDATPENLRRLSREHRIPLDSLIGHLAGKMERQLERVKLLTALKYEKK